MIVVAFVQTVASLMRQRLQAAPERLATYRRYLEMLANHVDRSAIPDRLREQ